MIKRKTIEIKVIKIGKRIRKDLGKLNSLKDSMQEIGLLHPIVLDETNKLVAGRRRVVAAKELGWKVIPFTRISIDSIMKGEFHENTVRKDFTVSEIASIVKEIQKRSRKPGKYSGKLPELEGEVRTNVAKITGKSSRTIQKIMNITKAAEKEPKKYKHILKKVDSGSLSVDTAHKIVTQETRNLPKIPLPKGKFDVILVDPALRFENRTIRGSSDNNYSTVQLEEIRKLSIPAAKNAIMFLWMPSSMFFDLAYHSGWSNYSTLEAILDGWGFKAKTFFVWDKEMISNGSWLRNQHENLVIAIKGKMPTPAKLYSSIIRAKRTKKHSEKPDIVYEMIEKMYPKRKYLELFARKKRKGWTSWGDEIAK